LATFGFIEGPANLRRRVPAPGYLPRLTLKKEPPENGHPVTVRETADPGGATVRIIVQDERTRCFRTTGDADFAPIGAAAPKVTFPRHVLAKQPTGSFVDEFIRAGLAGPSSAFARERNPCLHVEQVSDQTHPAAQFCGIGRRQIFQRSDSALLQNPYETFAGARQF
jgi:hypothetical protein